MIDVVCLGILVADVIARPVDELPHGAVSLMDEVSLHGGGCALNTATGLGRLGLSVAVVGKVGDDTFGDFVLGLLAERDLETEGVLREPAAPTSATVVLVDRVGERSFLHLPGANATLSADELSPAVSLRAGHCTLPAHSSCPGSTAFYGWIARGGATTRHPHLARHRLRCHWSLGWVELCLPHLDLLTMSLPEAQGLHRAWTSRAAAWLRSRGVSEVALTLGPKAATSGAEFEGEVPAIVVCAVDGTERGRARRRHPLRRPRRPLVDAARLANAAGPWRHCGRQPRAPRPTRLWPSRVCGRR